MISKPLLSIIIIAYLILLFVLAYLAEQSRLKKFVGHPFIYVLSLGVYCSAWTYYGSIGIAAKNGIEFLPIYLGPVIVIPAWIFILKKVIQVSKQNNVASIADFLSLRYGNSRFLGALVTFVCLVAILPYISLQLKAVSETFQLITTKQIVKPGSFTKDSSFYIALTLGLFSALFGTNSSDASQGRSGVLFVVAIESFLKLLFFLIAGFYITFIVFKGPHEILQQAQEQLHFNHFTAFQSLEDVMNWQFLIPLSMFAIFLLPRQFHIAVVENKSFKQLHTSLWAFPLYLLLFNFFVIFIAWAGNLLLPEGTKADYYSLLLPISRGNSFISLLVFMGGFSAVISMVVVSTIALSTMLSNNVIIPYGVLQRLSVNEPTKNKQLILWIRRALVFAIILISYILLHSFRVELSLFSIGLVAFLFIAQLAPSFFIGLYWSRGSSFGAIAGIFVGLLVCVFLYLVPYWEVPYFTKTLSEAGFLGLSSLPPNNLFGFATLNPIQNAFFWSMVANSFVYVFISLGIVSHYRERNYAEMVVNLNYQFDSEDAFVWKGKADIDAIKELLVRFLGERQVEKAIAKFNENNSRFREIENEDARFINFSEKLLTGTIGAASAKILLSNVTHEQPVSLYELLEILEENRAALLSNKKLKEKSQQLAKITDELQKANQELIEQDEIKDSFLDTVAHELKTPIASIRASSELLVEEDLPLELKEQFLANIQQDSERLTDLVNTILDIEKLQRGKEHLQLVPVNLSEFVPNSISRFYPILKDTGIKIELNIEPNLMANIHENRMSQVLTNLVSNSLKFIDEKKGLIQLTAKQFQNHIELTVTDNGKGFVKNDIPMVFDKFFQSKNQLLKAKGSGLGLSICKQIVEAHNGKIFIDENVKTGARITIRLPKAEVE